MHATQASDNSSLEYFLIDLGSGRKLKIESQRLILSSSGALIPPARLDLSDKLLDAESGEDLTISSIRRLVGSIPITTTIENTSTEGDFSEIAGVIVC